MPGGTSPPTSKRPVPGIVPGSTEGRAVVVVEEAAAVLVAPEAPGDPAVVADVVAAGSDDWPEQPEIASPRTASTPAATVDPNVPARIGFTRAP